MIETILSIPKMLSVGEKQYLTMYAQNEYSASGEIVDLGCWLGSSAVSLITGLQNNPNLNAREKIVHAYDLFIWESWMDQFVSGTPLEDRYQPGDSFLSECLKYIHPWEQQIKLYPGDLSKIGWQGGSIEFLFIDAMKSWHLANSILHDFFPSLIPGRSVVVHQDFAHFGTYWIHLVMYRLRAYFKPIYDIPDSWGVVFQYQQPIPDSLLRASYSLTSFDRHEIDAAFEYSKEIVAIQKRAQITGAKAIVLLELGEFQQVQQEIEQAIDDGLSYMDLQPPLGLGLSSLILKYIAASGRLASPVSREVETTPTQIAQPIQDQSGDLEYTGERHMADRLEEGLSLSHIDHMVRYAFVTPFVNGKRVLDITCGSGYGSQFMAIQGAREVIGVDIDANAIAHARKFYQHPCVSYIESDAHAVPQLEDASFDTIVSFETIEHLQHPHNFLLEIRRLLKPGGQLLLSCPNDYRVSPWISEYHLHKFRFTEFRDMVLNIFGESDFLFQYNTATSCLIKPIPIQAKSSRFQNYLRPVEQDYFENQYLDDLFTVDNALGYLAIVGVDIDRLPNCMSISQTAFQDVMNSLYFQMGEVNRLKQQLATSTANYQEELAALTANHEQQLAINTVNYQKKILSIDQLQGTIDRNQGSRYWHLQQLLQHLKKVLLS